MLVPRKYIAYHKISLQNAIEYRSEGFVWFLSDVMPSLVILLFWYAAFRTRSNISGYTYPEMSAYYLGMLVMQTLATPHPEESMVRDIKEGVLNFYLIKPLSVAGVRIFGEIAWKVVRLLFLLPLFLVIFMVFRLLNLPFADVTLGKLFILSLGLISSFILQYIIRLTVASSSFWVLDPWGILGLFELTIALFSGAMIPLDLLPSPLKAIAQFLPFRYFYFFPLSAFLGKVHGSSLYISFIIQTFWIFASTIVLVVVIKRGLKVYCAYGG